STTSSDVKFYVELLEVRPRPAGRSKNLGDVVSVGKGEHSRRVRDWLGPRWQVLCDCRHGHLHPGVFGQCAPPNERHARTWGSDLAHILEGRYPITEEHHAEGRDQQIVFVQRGSGGISLPPNDICNAGGSCSSFTLSQHRRGDVQSHNVAGWTYGS